MSADPRFAAQLVVRMGDDLHAQVKARAAAEDRSMAQVVRRALRVYLAESEAGEGGE